MTLSATSDLVGRVHAGYVRTYVHTKSCNLAQFPSNLEVNSKIPSINNNHCLKFVAYMAAMYSIRPTPNELLQLLLGAEVAGVPTLLLAAVVGSWVEPGVTPEGRAGVGQVHYIQLMSFVTRKP